MVDTVLSASALPRAILDNCKVFLLVTASPPLTTMGERKRPKLSEVRDGAGATPRERVVGVVVAQRIRWAMRVLRDSEQREGDGLKIVDSGGGVICE
jgi:N-acetyltransferase